MRRVPDDELEPAFRAKVQRVRSLVGDVRFLEVAANAPHMVDFYWGDFYRDVFFAGVLDVRTKELVRLLLADIHGCMFCQAGDAESARANGVTDEEIAGLWDFERGPFSERERVVLRVAAGISLRGPDGPLPAATREALEEHLTDEQIVELLMVCGVLTGMARMMVAMDLADRSDACPVLPEQP